MKFQLNEREVSGADADGMCRVLLSSQSGLSIRVVVQQDDPILTVTMPVMVTIETAVIVGDTPGEPA